MANMTDYPILASDDFNWVEDLTTRNMLMNAYYAICNVNAWDWIKSFGDDSFMWSSDPKIKEIVSSMESLGYDDHTGFTFDWTMRQMKLLVKKGSFLPHTLRIPTYANI